MMKDIVQICKDFISGKINIETYRQEMREEIASLNLDELVSLAYTIIRDVEMAAKLDAAERLLSLTEGNFQRAVQQRNDERALLASAKKRTKILTIICCYWWARGLGKHNAGCKRGE